MKNNLIRAIGVGLFFTAVISSLEVAAVITVAGAKWPKDATLASLVILGCLVFSGLTALLPSWAYLLWLRGEKERASMTLYIRGLNMAGFSLILMASGIGGQHSHWRQFLAVYGVPLLCGILCVATGWRMLVVRKQASVAAVKD